MNPNEAIIELAKENSELKNELYDAITLLGEVFTFLNRNFYDASDPEYIELCEKVKKITQE